MLYAMTKGIYIAIRVKQYQYIFYLKVKACSKFNHSCCLEFSLVGFCVAYYWYWLLGCKWLSLSCIATEVVVSQAEDHVSPLSIFEGEKAREVFGEEPC